VAATAARQEAPRRVQAVAQAQAAVAAAVAQVRAAVAAATVQAVATVREEATAQAEEDKFHTGNEV